MDKQINFCGGLPRAGSTVLMNILQQNPRIFTTGTDPLPKLVERTLVANRHDEPFQAMDIEVADKAMHGFVTSGIQGWFNALTEKPVVISKSRSWANLYHLLPNGKYIAMIRDLRDIVESFERLQRKALALHSYDKNGSLVAGMSVQEKYQYYFKSGTALAGAYSIELPRITEHAKQGNRDVLFVRYEDLTIDPTRQLKRVYDFLDEEYYEHDLENIKQSELFEHDAVYFRERTSHKVHPSLLSKPVEPRMCSSELLKHIVKDNIPYYKTFYPEVAI